MKAKPASNWAPRNSVGSVLDGGNAWINSSIWCRSRSSSRLAATASMAVMRASSPGGGRVLHPTGLPWRATNPPLVWGRVPRPFRFVVIIAATALVITGMVSGLAAVGNGLLHHTATAELVALPPLGSKGALGGSTVVRRRRNHRVGRAARLPRPPDGSLGQGVEAARHRGVGHRGPSLLSARRIRRPVDSPGLGRRLVWFREASKAGRPSPSNWSNRRT